MSMRLENQCLGIGSDGLKTQAAYIIYLFVFLELPKMKYQDVLPTPPPL